MSSDRRLNAVLVPNGYFRDTPLPLLFFGADFRAQCAKPRCNC